MGHTNPRTQSIMFIRESAEQIPRLTHTVFIVNNRLRAKIDQNPQRKRLPGRGGNKIAKRPRKKSVEHIF